MYNEKLHASISAAGADIGCKGYAVTIALIYLFVEIV
jgi:hypothetical protein